MNASWMSLVWFALVIALIPVLLWLLKRSGKVTGSLPGQPAATRLVHSLGLGPQQRVVTVEVGQGTERRWLVLGVTAQHIQTLHVLEQPPATPETAPLPLPGWLARWAPPTATAAPSAGATLSRKDDHGR